MQRWIPTIQKYIFITSKPERCYMLYNLRCFHSTEKSSNGVDVIDEFSIKLCKEKAERWRKIMKENKLKRELKTISVSTWTFDLKNRLSSAFHYSKTLNVEIVNLSTEQIDSLITGALESKNLGDVEYLIQQCVDTKHCPSIDVLMDLLALYSHKGNTNIVTSLIDLCCETQHDEFHKNFQLKHFRAKLIWMKGDVEKSVNMLIDMYSKHEESKSLIRVMLKSLINDSVSFKSEATVVKLSRCLGEFGVQFDDWGPLSYLWEYCWLSEWFSDHQVAESLFNEHKPMRMRLYDRIQALSTIALNDHQEDAVLRLLQMLLHNKMMFLYARVLDNLFIYRYRRDDVYGCHQIVRNCIPLNIRLRSDLQTKYLTMLISHGYAVRQPEEPKEIPAPSPVKYRF